MPLYRRIPKRGFNNIFRRRYACVNVETLNRFDEGSEITPELLLDKRVIKSLKNGVRILGNGDLKKPLVVRAHKFSKRAVEKIEAAGGRAEVI